MKIHVHIGEVWQTLGHKTYTCTFPEISGNRPKPARQIVDEMNLLLEIRDEDFHLLTLSPIVFDALRVAKRMSRDRYEIIVYFDGISCEVDSDGRMERFPSEFDVHGDLLCRLL